MAAMRGLARSGVMAAAAALVAAGLTAVWSRQAAPAVALSAPVRLPFALVNGLIVMSARINGSAPLSFVVDTGARPSIVDLERARDLGLALGSAVRVGGTGPGSSTGAVVRNATLTVDGVDGFAQGVTLAIPLSAVSRRVGQRLDGIVGADFLRAFVAEVDYTARAVTLHDARGFAYRGGGQIVAMTLDTNGHPIFAARVTPAGRPAIDATFKLDLGGTGAVTLHSPFVARHGLPSRGEATIQSFGAVGMGGRSTGRTGRLASLQIGDVVLDRPPVLLSGDTDGAYASAATDGHVGGRVASRFRIFLDYHRSRLIFEPNATSGDSFDRPAAGLAIEAEGADYRVFRVVEVLEGGAAAAAGVRAGDVITTLDGRAAALLSLDEVLRRLERAEPCALGLRRDGASIQVTLTPRHLI